MARTYPSPKSSLSAVAPASSDSPTPPLPAPPASSNSPTPPLPFPPPPEQSTSPPEPLSPPLLAPPPPEQSTSPPPEPPSSEPTDTSPGGPSATSAPPPLSPPNRPSPPSTSPPPESPAPPMGSSPPPTTFPPPQGSPPPAQVPPPPADGPPPSVSPPPPNPTSPPPSSSSPPPKPSSPPLTSPPPPPADPPASPPPPPSTNPPQGSPPPPSSTPPTDPSPPPPEPPKNAPPPPRPPESSPPPPSTDPPKNSPTPPSPDPPQNSPPSPPSPNPPENSPPSPSTDPPQNSPPSPPSPNPPKNSPPPPVTEPPQSSPPPPVSGPPSTSAPPPKPPSIPPSPGSPPSSSPPPPVAQLSPPPRPRSPPSPSGPSRFPPNAPTTNASDNSNTRRGEGIGTAGSVVIGLGLTAVLLGIIGTIAWYLWKRKKKVPGATAGHVMPTSIGSSPASESGLLKGQVSAANAGSGPGPSSPSEPGGLGNSRSWFTYEELSGATSGFSAQYLLGEGGFGSVYKGCLADGREVAVKQLKVGGGQGDREFRAEVEIISRVHHRHLVSLVGYCISDSRRLLVYDYVPNNTLHFHLHGEGTPVLGWAARVKIAIGAARGIAYLHEDCHPRIIHRDIKSSNILLDNNFEARVSDFGLAKLCLDTNTHVTTRVMGTFGYMAPEYASSGKLTEKSDVFSFGVVLLELISGRKPVDTSQPLGDESLVEWARPLLNHALDTEEFQNLVDPRLEKFYVNTEMFLMIEAAAACVRHSSAKRPRMTQVVRAFDSMSTSDLTNGMRVGESEVFNSAQQSAEIRLFRRMAFGGSQDFSTDFYSQASRNSEER